jgi:putative ABC transport system ATP-binding protein
MTATPIRSTQTSSIITIERVGKIVDGPRGELCILEGIDFDITARERVAITGVSGSGKSTLLGLLAGLDTVSSGRITVLGHDLGQMDEDARARLRRDHVGFVFQAFHLVSSFTALENVMLPLELKGAPRPRAVAAAMLDRVGLSARLQHFPHQLSGGEQQRVALARAFCTSPDILYADEPTGNLDALTAQGVTALLFELNEEFGTTLIVVTHDARLADACERRIALDGGRVVA